MSPDRRTGPALHNGTGSGISVATKIAPSVAQLVDHLEQVQRRVVQDAFSEARASYWRRRAAAFRAALPRQDEWHGREGLASVRMRRDRLKAIIAACESAAEVALWQDGNRDGV